MTDQTKRDQEVRAMLRQALRANAHRLLGHKVVLYGPRATGRARERSDYDLGVVGDAPLPLEGFYAIEDAREALPTLYRIDWVDLMRTAERFRARALKEAEILCQCALDSV